MAFKKVSRGTMFKVGGKTILIKKDGSVNQKDLDKLTIDELFVVLKTQCSGSVRDILINGILKQ